MRLTKQQEQDATQELLEILEAHPQGLPTSQLSGTWKFHGEKTLRNPQIIRLLRKSGQATMSISGYGLRTQGWWKSKGGEHSAK